MLVITPKGFAYSFIVFGVVMLAALAGLNFVRGVSAQTPDSGVGNELRTVQEVCLGKGEALAILREVQSLDNVSPLTNAEIGAVIDAINESINADVSSQWELASAKAREVIAMLAEMTTKAAGGENAGLVEMLGKATASIFTCVEGDQPDPQPDPDVGPTPGPDVELAPGHRPVVGLVYSAKYTCGTQSHKEGMSTKRFGEQPYLSEREVFKTEISIHNYSNNRVTFWLRPSEAPPIGHRGHVGRRIKQTLRPHQAVSVNCAQIARMLQPAPRPLPNPVPHEVCEGKREALLVLREALGTLSNVSDTTTQPPIPADAVQGLIDALFKAIELEELGRLRKALEIEHGITDRLERLTAIAREQGNETLANLFAKANELVHSCIRILKSDIDRLSDTDSAIRPHDRPNVNRAKRVNSGFVAIETRRQLEVTASYGVKSSITTTGGGSGSGVSTEVVQIRPHRVTAPHPRPVPVDPIEPAEPVQPDQPDAPPTVDGQQNDTIVVPTPVAPPAPPQNIQRNFRLL